MASRRGQRRKEQRQQESTEERKRQILVKYARLSENGVPKLCQATKQEFADRSKNWRTQNGDDKVILRDEQAASNCADEMGALFGSPYWTYPCPRSKHGHYHLTSTPPRKADPCPTNTTP